MKAYHIFARKRYQEPLAFITVLKVDDEQHFEKHVLQKTGSKEWIEMIAVPEDSIAHVVRKGKIQ